MPSLLSLRFALQMTSRLLLAALVVNSRGMTSQTAVQPPSNYQGPTLYGVCVYILADTSYYSSIFSTSGYYKFKAQQAFRDYATAQAKGAALKGEACRWSTSQDEVTTQKAADKRLLGLNGRSTKGIETGWVFNPATGTSATTHSTAQGSSSAGIAASGAKAANGTGSQSAIGASSIGSSTEQTMQDSLAASKATAAGAVNDTVATTMGTVSSGANNALKSMFNRKSKAAAGDPQAVGTANAANSQSTAAAAAVNGQTPAPLGLQDTESPQVATAEAQHVEGIVADVAGNDIIINVGLQAGVRVGAKLAVMHAVRTVKDPMTGKLLRTIEDKVGELTIKNADATSAAGVFAGAGSAKVGDIVRLASSQ